MHLGEDKALSNKMWVHMMIIRKNEKSSKSYVNLTYFIRNGNMIRHFFYDKTWSVRFSNYNQIALVLNIVSFTVFTLTASVNSSWKSMGKVIYVLPACRRLLCSACNKGNRRRLHAGKYMFGKSSFLLTSTDDRIQKFSSMSRAFPGQSSVNSL